MLARIWGTLSYYVVFLLTKIVRGMVGSKSGPNSVDHALYFVYVPNDSSKVLTGYIWWCHKRAEPSVTFQEVVITCTSREVNGARRPRTSGRPCVFEAKQTTPPPPKHLRIQVKPPNLQKHGDRDHLETVYDETRPTC